MKTIAPAALLRRALAADAIASGGIALLQLAAAERLAAATLLPRALLLETGAFLVAYTALLVAMTFARRLPAALVGVVIAGNVGWALGAFAVLPLLAPNAAGIGFVALHIAAVLGFAALQAAGLKSSAAAGDGAALAR